ncbi:hypothetical protein RZS08_60110, partial [Arthrospira platensis SPKY1]|nr:hypothetical protein [Arthrospira platensis SPKY1]
LAQRQPTRRIQGPAPLAGIHRCSRDAVGAEALADRPRLGMARRRQVALRAAVFHAKARRVARTRGQRVAHQGHMPTRAQRRPQRGFLFLHGRVGTRSGRQQGEEQDQDQQQRSH